MMAVKKMCIPWKRRNVPAGPQPTADLTLNFNGKKSGICPRICAKKTLKRKLLRAEKMIFMCHSGVPSVQNLFLLLHIYKEANRTICSKSVPFCSVICNPKR